MIDIREYKRYEISKHRFQEIRHHCLQYPEWKEQLSTLTDAVKSIEYGKEGSGGTLEGSSTEELGIKRAELSGKIDLIESTVREADPEIYEWLLEGVTTDYATYNYLRTVKGLPCGDQKYYQSRRKFYYLMSKKI